jgi:tetratricopeptide (TPR) repeat protein
MIARAIFAGIFLLVSAQSAVAADEVYVPSLDGRVFADGRPVDWLLEIRLERRDSSMIATAYTRGSFDFGFRRIRINRGEDLFLVIKEQGYKELRHMINFDDFDEDPRIRGVFMFGGIIDLNLESLPKEEKQGSTRITGPMAVDVRQLGAQISEEARREYSRALEAIAKGNSDAARSHLEKAVRIAPNYYDALNKLGVEYLKAAQYRKAEAVLNRAHEIDPTDRIPLTNLGILHMQEGDSIASAGPGTAKTCYSRAVAVFEEALSLAPTTARANYFLGAALYKTGVYERAESLLIKALTLDSQVHEARLTLLNIYIQRRDYDAALKQISAYLKENPDGPHKPQLEALRAQIESALNK